MFQLLLCLFLFFSDLQHLGFDLDLFFFKVFDACFCLIFFLLRRFYIQAGSILANKGVLQRSTALFQLCPAFIPVFFEVFDRNEQLIYRFGMRLYLTFQFFHLTSASQKVAAVFKRAAADRTARG